MIHSVDSLGLAQDMNRIAEEQGCIREVLLEVNGRRGEQVRISPEKLRDQMEELRALRGCRSGLMTIPPLAEEAEASRKYFCSIARVARSPANRIPCGSCPALNGDDRRFRSRS